MADVRTVLRDDPGRGDGYALAVALAGADPMEQLLRTATDLARAKGGRILLVGVVHKPVTSPFLLFSEAHIAAEYDEGGRELLDRAAGLVGDVPVGRHLLVGDDVSAAIGRAVEAGGADALLLGWRDRPRPSDIVLGTTVDPIVRRAPADVYVERVGTTADGVRSVLFPTVAGAHLAPAADLASAVARANDAAVTAVTYVPPGAGGSARRTAADRLDRAAAAVEAPLERRVDETDDVAGRIVETAADHDLVVLGATRERSFRRRVVGSTARAVVAAADPPVVVAKRRHEGSFFGLGGFLPR